VQWLLRVRWLPTYDGSYFGYGVIQERITKAPVVQKLSIKRQEIRPMENSLLAQDRLLTFDEVKTFLSISESTLRRFIRSGKLKFCRLGRQLRFRPSAVVRFLAERES
jgi:excisionase family DNA binding protein